MNQELFEARHGASWQEFEDWLDAARGAQARPGIAAGEFPRRYRILCQHLALARDRAYSAALVERLNGLVLRGHHLLYGASGDRRNAFLRYFYQGLPRTVRAERRLVWIAAGLFFGPLLLLGLLVQAWPATVHLFLEPGQIADIESMYGPGVKQLGAREADADFGMFGFYIWNNVKIGFQTFATGVTFGVGTVLFLLFNGVQIGTVAGHLVQAGLALVQSLRQK
mgnify:CR=1 FL=1